MTSLYPYIEEAKTNEYWHDNAIDNNIFAWKIPEMI